MHHRQDMPDAARVIPLVATILPQRGKGKIKKANECTAAAAPTARGASRHLPFFMSSI